MVFSELFSNPLVLIGVALALAHGVLVCAVIRALVVHSRDRIEVRRELLELLRKLEALTASSREQMVRHYDGMLAELVERLPEEIAAETGHKIFDTESRILTRLAEIEPDLRRDPLGRAKLNELIESMESLETELVSIAADSVKKAIAAGRETLLSRAPFAARSDREGC